MVNKGRLIMESPLLAPSKVSSLLLKSATQPNLVLNLEEPEERDRRKADFERRASKGNGIADRLAALQKSSDTDWIKRAARTESVKKTPLTAPEQKPLPAKLPNLILNGNKNLKTKANDANDSANETPVVLRPKKDNNVKKSSSIADRMSMLQDSAKTWKTKTDGEEPSPAAPKQASDKLKSRQSMLENMLMPGTPKLIIDPLSKVIPTKMSDPPKRLSMPAPIKSHSSANLARVMKNGVAVFPFTPRPAAKSMSSSTGSAESAPTSASDSEPDEQQASRTNNIAKSQERTVSKATASSVKTRDLMPCLPCLAKSQSEGGCKTKGSSTKVLIPKIVDEYFDSFFESSSSSKKISQDPLDITDFNLNEVEKSTSAL